MTTLLGVLFGDNTKYSLSFLLRKAIFLMTIIISPQLLVWYLHCYKSYETVYFTFSNLYDGT